MAFVIRQATVDDTTALVATLTEAAGTVVLAFPPPDMAREAKKAAPNATAAPMSSRTTRRPVSTSCPILAGFSCA